MQRVCYNALCCTGSLCRIAPALHGMLCSIDTSLCTTYAAQFTLRLNATGACHLPNPCLPATVHITCSTNKPCILSQLFRTAHVPNSIPQALRRERERRMAEMRQQHKYEREIARRKAYVTRCRQEVENRVRDMEEQQRREEEARKKVGAAGCGARCCSVVRCDWLGAGTGWVARGCT